MHRSGTSTATRMASLLGLPTCDPADLTDDRRGNERGIWESASLVRANDRLLAGADAAWWCPPPAGHEWSAAAEAQGETARRCFRAAHRGPYWVWKDPRNCLTLSFWLRALAIRPAVVLMVRDPLEVCASLTARNQFSKLAVLALWERYLREALAQAAGLPVLVTDYAELLADPAAWCRAVAGLLADAGNPVQASRGALASSYLSGGLRHHRHSPGDLDADPDVSAEQRRLAGTLSAARGPHYRFDVPDLGPETPGTEQFFARQRLDHGLARRNGRPAARPLPSRISLFAPRRADTRPRPAASVVVISRDEGAWLRGTVDRLAATTGPDTEIVVVDDGSSDGSAEGLGPHPRLRIARPPGPLGIARARNFGASLARGKLLVFSDAHVAPAPGWLPAVQAALGAPQAGAANPLIGQFAHPERVVNGLTFDGPALNVRWVAEPERHEPFPVPLLTGCFLAIRRAVFEAAGGFDDGMRGYGAEDLELCLRLWRMGYTCLSVPGASVAHRFRAGRQVDRTGFLHNLLRMATLHLSAGALRHMVAVLGRDPALPAAMAQVLAADTGRRRAEVGALCCYPDRWFFQRFGPACYARPPNPVEETP